MIKKVLEDTGGITLLFYRSMKNFLKHGFDVSEFLRIFYLFSVKSLLIVLITSVFVGFIMVLQVSNYIRMLQATGIVGWASGLAIFREVGPVLMGIMFSGQAGAFNASEIGLMKITNQIETMRALGLAPYKILVTPRIFAMGLVLFFLVIMGDFAGIVGAMFFSKLLFNINFSYFVITMIQKNLVSDFLIGVFKSVLFGISIGVTSCYFGLEVKREPREVGIAVNNSVVTSAVLILLIDYVISIIG